jgi:hypothetical protein
MRLAAALVGNQRPEFYAGFVTKVMATIAKNAPTRG